MRNSRAILLNFIFLFIIIFARNLMIAVIASAGLQYALITH